MDDKKKRHIQSALKRLAESHAATMAFLEETSFFICDELDLDRIGPVPTIAAPGALPEESQSSLLDRQLLSVVYGGRRCFLGNTLPFKLFDRLARRPDQYISNKRLLEDVWKGCRTNAAVRSVVKVLRSKLRDAGMKRVADAIDGQVAGHYAFLTSQL